MISRRAWGAVPPKWTNPPMRTSAGVFLHYNGPPVSAGVYRGEPGTVKAFLRSIQGFHMNTQGWPDIAYSFAVDTEGRSYELRGWGAQQAATVNWNHRSHSVFMMLGVGQPPTEKQWAAVRGIVAEHNRRYGVGFVKGHREAPNPTSCPGDLIISGIRAGKASGGTVGPSGPPPAPNPSIPRPPGVTEMNEPKMIKIGPHVWMFYDNTPFRVRVGTPNDVAAFRFMGVPYSEMSERQGNLFLRHTQAVRTG